MLRVLTAEAMAAADRYAIEEIGIPGLVLMENAALGVVDALCARYPEARSVVVLCGPGNNGGDGLAIARQLATRGFRAVVVLWRGSGEPRGDAATQLAICRALELPIVEAKRRSDFERIHRECRHADVVVDALFGTGLSRPLSGLTAALVECVSGAGRPIVAVDLPSGLSGSRADLPGPHFRADLTVTFAALKVAHALPPAADAMGEVAIADLGVPAMLLDRVGGELFVVEPDDVRSLLPPRHSDTHKGTFGHVLLVAGGPGRAGAAILGARAAVRAGAGLVTVAPPLAQRETVDLGSIESMTLGLPMGEEGELGAAAVEVVLAAAIGKDVLALGPGLGSLGETQAVVRGIVSRCALPAVLDADALNAFAGRLGELARRGAPTLLTPHPGELGRLLGVSTREVTADRLGTARRAAERSGAVVLLKGHRTLIACPGGYTYVNPTGNPAMATGGSGDVLTGIIAALVAQGLEVGEAAWAGAFLHGRAGDLAAGQAPGRCLAATDLVDWLAAAYAGLDAA